jgi:RNase adaptor protein for sRNA GlmZ degradation
MILSFGFSHGLPGRAARVFDVRDLSHDTNSDAFRQRCAEMVDWGTAHPGQDFAIGCEKGKHRSVVAANSVATTLKTSVMHRDRGRR